MPPPVVRAEADILAGSSKYRFADIARFEAAGQEEQRAEHRDHIAKARLPNKAAFSLNLQPEPGTSIQSIDGYKNLEKDFARMATNAGLEPIFMIWTITQEYQAPINIGDLLPDGTQAQAGDVRAEVDIVYAQTPFFGAQNPISLEDCKRTCRILNQHADITHMIGNRLGIAIV